MRHVLTVSDVPGLPVMRRGLPEVVSGESNCLRTGSVVFAAAGLLGSRPATSNRNSLDHMKSLDVVGRLAGPERAREVREGFD